MKNTIFFDFDGVLVDSEKIHTKAWNLLLKDLKIEKKISLKDVMGIADLDIANLIIKKNKLSFKKNDLILKKRDFFLTVIDEIKIPENRDEILFDLKKSFKKIAIVSSSLKEDIELILKKQNILNIFDFIISANDVKKHKPNPESYNLALKKAKSPYQNCIAVEDSLAGIEAAKKAKIDVIAFNNKVSDTLFCKDYTNLKKILL
jgi:HAD superfamily hydrolase (TIGR01549 family)